MNTSKIRELSIGILIGLFLSVIAGGFYFALKTYPFDDSENIIIEYPYNHRYVAQVFLSRGIGQHALINKYIIKISKLCGYKIKFGEYYIPKRVSLWQAIKIISLGKRVMHKFCIPEGVAVVRIIRKLNDNKFLQGEISEIPKEGSLMPDTYCFYYPTTRQDIIKQAQTEMSRFLETEWEKRSPLCFLKTPEEALVLASIVEKESNIQRDVVAGMYLHRLKKHMKLQACPTVIYAMVKGDKFTGKLRYENLTLDSPYNTYKYEGLPPAPITNPGKSAILAVLHPKETDILFMYFDSSLEKPLFSRTYDEHKQNIAKVRNLNIASVK